MKHDSLFKITVAIGITFLILFTLAFFLSIGLFIWSEQIHEACHLSLWVSQAKEAFNYLGL